MPTPTSIRTRCVGCLWPINEGEWLCDHCKKVANPRRKCLVCLHPVPSTQWVCPLCQQEHSLSATADGWPAGFRDMLPPFWMTPKELAAEKAKEAACEARLAERERRENERDETEAGWEAPVLPSQRPDPIRAAWAVLDWMGVRNE